jgi:Sulfotransferase family
MVVSASRSGSTLLRYLLRSHPALAISRAYLADFLKVCHLMAGVPRGAPFELPGLSFAGVLEDENRDIFLKLHLSLMKNLVHDFYVESFPDKEFTRWGDQVHSTFALPEILMQWPNAQFIHLVRDGRDRLVSHFHWHERRQKIDSFLQESTVETQSHYWVNVNRDLFEMLDEGRSKVVYYEDLVRDPVRTLEEIVGFIDVDFAPEMRAYLEESAGEFFTRHGTSPSPEASIGRWRHELTAEQQRVANEIMGAMLERAGYPVE